MGFATIDDSDLASLPPNLDSLVRSELAEGEKVAWVGQPRAGRMMLAMLPVFVSGIFFGGFAVFWTAMASRAGLFALFGLPFLAVGLGMIASPFWAGRQASRTCYVLTNRRAIVFEAGLWDGLRVRSYDPEDLRRIWRAERGDGSGDLVFEEMTTHGRRGRSHVTRRGFLAIDRVREVEALVRSSFPDAIDRPGRMRLDLESP